MKIKKIDLIIPSYNPINNWEEEIISSYQRLSKNSSIQFNIILINDGSKISESSIKKIESKIEHFSYYSYDENQGKGYAIRYGVGKSLEDNIIFTDVDFPYGTSSILEMVEKLENGADLVLALRNESYYSNISTSRKIISKILKLTIKTFFRVPISDTQGGLKALSLKAKNQLLNTTINRYLFDLELVKLCSKQKLKIIGIGCTLKPNIILSSVGLNILKNEFSNFIKILRL